MSTKDIAFYLNARPNGGGANSVVQEFLALAHNFGIGHLVVPEEFLTEFDIAYGLRSRAPDRLHTSLATVPKGTTLVATTNHSLVTVVNHETESDRSVFYYVQDFEPLFYRRETVDDQVALDSYGLANSVTAVVKTNWLKSVMLAETFMPVVKIRPSIDRSLYFPETLTSVGRVLVVAMIRPTSPRRGPRRTVALLNRLAMEQRGDTDIVVFGGTPDELAASGLVLHPSVINLGRISPASVAPLMRRASVVLDASDYQAFGRTVAEGMACGALPVVTCFGGPSEFVEDGKCGWLFDPADLDQAFQDLTDATRLGGAERDLMREHAISAVADWSDVSTASDWYALIQDLPRRGEP